MTNDKVYVGQLDRRVAIHRYTTVKDDIGESNKQQQLLVETWSKVQHVSGTEQTEGKVISLNVRDYIIRFVQAVYDDGEMLGIVDALDQGVFDIYAVEMIGRKEYLRLKARRRE